MASIQRTEWGLHVRAEGYLSVEDAHAFQAAVLPLLETMPPGFGVLVDTRGQRANSLEAQALIQEVMEAMRVAGQGRCAVVLDSHLSQRQVTRMAHSARVDALARYLHAPSLPDCEARAMAWILHGVEPLPTASAA